MRAFIFHFRLLYCLIRFRFFPTHTRQKKHEAINKTQNMNINMFKIKLDFNWPSPWKWVKQLDFVIIMSNRSDDSEKRSDANQLINSLLLMVSYHLCGMKIGWFVCWLYQMKFVTYPREQEKINVREPSNVMICIDI